MEKKTTQFARYEFGPNTILIYSLALALIFGSGGFKLREWTTIPEARSSECQNAQKEGFNKGKAWAFQLASEMLQKNHLLNNALPKGNREFMTISDSELQFRKKIQEETETLTGILLDSSKACKKSTLAGM